VETIRFRACHALPGNNPGDLSSLDVRWVSVPLAAFGLRTSAKRKLTPFRSRYRKLRNFRFADQQDTTCKHCAVTMDLSR
jgi:hypothetical protein